VAKVVAPSRETPPPANMPEEEPPFPPEPSSSALAWETAPIAHSTEAESAIGSVTQSATVTSATATPSAFTATSGKAATSHTTVRGAVPAVLRPENVPPARQRYGESVVREILGASFIEEQPYEPRVIPRGD
jgi:DNA polymerase III subunit gamma/tau